MTGTVLAQALGILIMPVVTRLFAPEAFGVAAIFSSMTGIIGVVVCLRYELAIMLPDSNEEAVNILGVSLLSVIIMTSLSALIVWLGNEKIISLLHAPQLKNYLWLVPVAIFIQGIFLALNYWNSRTKHFGRLSIARVTSSLTTTTITLGFGVAGHATGGTLVGAGIAGHAVATSVLGGQIWRDDGKMFLNTIRWQAMKKGIKRYKKFPMFDSWAALMNAISGHLPPLLLAVFFSSTVVGFYALGYRLLSLPIGLIGGSIAQVFFQRAAVANNDGTLPLVVRKTFLRLISLGSFPLLLVMVIGKDIFSVVFGSQWAAAGVYAQILSPWLLFVFLGSPISTLFSILEIQGSFLLFNSVLLAARVASLVAGGLANSILMALMLYAGTGTVMWIGLCVYLFWKAGSPIRVLVRDVMQAMGIAAIALLPLLVLKGCGVRPLFIVIAGCLSGFFYYTILYFRDEELRKLVAHFTGRLFRST